MNESKVLHKILPAPKKPTHLPLDIHWLSGEGCGSWFHIERVVSSFVILRYNPEGGAECKGIFDQVSGAQIDLNAKYEFTYLSHCAEINIIQNHQNLKFKLIKKI